MDDFSIAGFRDLRLHGVQQFEKFCREQKRKAWGKCRNLSAVFVFQKNLTVRALEVCQVITSVEHRARFRSLGSPKAADIQTGQAAAIVEHIPHIRYIRGIKITETKAGQVVTKAEH